MSVLFGASKGLIKKYGDGKNMYVARTDASEDFFVDSIKPHVIFICGARGSGKSYTMGVLVEELAYKNDAVASIVVDPIGVFWSMKKANKSEREKESLEKWNLEPRGFDNIRVLVPIGAKKLPPQSFQGYFSLEPSELTASDWTFTFGLERFSPAGLLIDNAIQKLGDSFDIDDLVHIIETDEDFQSKERGFSRQTRRGLISRFESAKFWGIFGKKPTPLEHIAQCGKVTVLDISFLEEAVAAMVVGIIARKSLDRRKIESRKEALGQPSNFPPIWLFIDEAHIMVPKDRKTAASDSIIEYVKQGRKPGCSIVLATQQPSSINSEVLSQLDMMFVHQLVFEDDIKAVRKRMPAALPKEWNVNFIRKLKIGEALVGDRETTGVALIKTRPRMSQHEGRSTLALEKLTPILEVKDPIIKTDEIEELEKQSEFKKAKKKVRGKRISSLRSKLDLEDIEELLSKKTGFALFKRKEKYDVKMKVYWPFWLVKGMGLEGSIEFLFDGIFGEIEGSKGLQRLIELNPLAARIMNGPGTLEVISKRCGADSRMVKLQLNRLVNFGLVKVSGKVDKKYIPKLAFPSKLKQFTRKVIDVVPEGRIMKPIFDPDRKLCKLLGIKLIEKELIYIPFALFRTVKKQQIWVNLATGEMEQRRIKLKI